MFKRKTLIALTVAAIVPVVSASAWQWPPLTPVMNEKADNAQRILRPLVIGDLVTVDSYAERLGHLTSAEIASWQARPEPAYLAQANAFVEAVQELRESARLRDVKRASTAYTALISSCIGCHQQGRIGRSGTLTPPAPVVDPPTAGAGAR